MGYDYCIQYRSGNTNLVVDALSRILDSPEGTMFLLFIPCLTFLEELKEHLTQDPTFTQFWHEINTKPKDHPEYLVT